MKIKFNQKVFAGVIALLLILSVSYNIMQSIKNRELEKFRTDGFEQLKLEKESIIKEQEIKIDSLLLDNQMKDELLHEAEINYDSLQNQKDQVKVIYKTKYKEVEGFNAENIINYWTDEFDK